VPEEPNDCEVQVAGLRAGWNDIRGAAKRRSLSALWVRFPIGEFVKPLRGPLTDAVGAVLQGRSAVAELARVEALAGRYWPNRLPVELALLLRRLEEAAAYSWEAVSKNADHTV
jgi:hypothetical protein